MLLLVFGACIVPAGILILFELAASRFAPRADAAVHRVILALLLALTILPIVKRAVPLPGGVCVALAAIAAGVISVQYLRIRTWRWSVVYLSPALLVFPGLMLFTSPVSAILFPGRGPDLVRTRIGNPAPVVLLVFDEFPAASLMDKNGNVDAALYPNFAGLSRTGTWYRNATTVSDGTLISIPAILDGEYPTPDRPRLPNAAGHPNTLFTLLGGSYRMNVVENNTRLCPDALCGSSTAPVYRRIPPLVRDAGVLWLYAVLPSDLTGPLPDITQAWANFTAAPVDAPTLEMWNRFDDLTDWHDRAQEFRTFVDSIRPSPWPALHFLHILLPHAPWEYLPSGRRYPDSGGRIRGLRGPNDRGEDPNRWTGDSWAAVQSYQRHLLQVAFVDRLVGELLNHLRDAGLYDSSLVVITADHGTSFRPGEPRRLVTAANHGDIMAVPLFIKYPRQQQGKIDDRNAQTIDILPTIAEILQVKPGWKLAGRSLLGPETPAGARSIYSDTGRKFEFSGGLNDLYASVKYKLGIFGESGLYRAGDRYGLIGRTAPAAAPDPRLKYELDREAYYSKVDPGAPRLVTNITGRVVLGARPGGQGPLPLAIAVNGTIRAVTETYGAGRDEAFSAMAPETALRAGPNEIGVFLIRDSGKELAWLGRNTSQTYAWGTRLKFGIGGDAGPYYGTGWGMPEDRLTWTDAHAATLYMPAKAPGADLILRANVGGFTVPGKLEGQRVRVLVNGHEVTQWVVTSEFQERTAIVPRGYMSGAGTNEITFETPDAVAPISIGASNDSRTLGMAVIWLQFVPQDPSK